MRRPDMSLIFAHPVECLDHTPDAFNVNLIGHQAVAFQGRPDNGPTNE